MFVHTVKLSFVDPHHLDSDLDADPDSTDHPDADPDYYLFDVDPDQTFHPDADPAPDPDTSFNVKANNP